MKGGGVVGESQIGKGLQGDFALHQHGQRAHGGGEWGAHKQQRHADGGGIGAACPAVVAGEVVDDAHGGKHDAVAPVDGEGVVGIGADVGVAALRGGGQHFLVVEAFGAIAVEGQLFVSVQAGFVLALDFVVDAAHLAEAVVVALHHDVRAHYHRKHHQQGDKE